MSRNNRKSDNKKTTTLVATTSGLKSAVSITQDELESAGIKMEVGYGDILEVVANEKFKQLKESYYALRKGWDELMLEYETLVKVDMKAFIKELIKDKMIKNESDIIDQVSYYSDYNMPRSGEKGHKMMNRLMDKFYSGRGMHPFQMSEMFYMMEEQKYESVNQRKVFQFAGHDFSYNKEARIHASDKELWFPEDGKDFIVVMSVTAKSTIPSSKYEVSGVVTLTKKHTIPAKKFEDLEKKIKDYWVISKEYIDSIPNGGRVNLDVIIQEAKATMTKSILSTKTPELASKLEKLFGI